VSALVNAHELGSDLADCVQCQCQIVIRRHMARIGGKRSAGNDLMASSIQPARRHASPQLLM